MRYCVIGGGIVGLATARLITVQHPGSSVTVLEKEDAVATHQTGRNSGVVHAGVYYAPGSLKARLCRRGVSLLEAYCAEHGLPYERCGKLVVATHPGELGRLTALLKRATENGVPGLRMLGAEELREVEPHAAGIAALHSPTTAITDFGAVARRLAEEVVEAGGAVRLGARVVRVAHRDRAESSTPVAVLASGERVRADRIVVCAGLHADALAHGSPGVAPALRIVPFRGEYFALAPEQERLVRGLIYPVPDPALPFLGIHLTRTVGGGVLVGPNAVPALGRESYRWRDLDRRELGAVARWPGTWRVLRDHWRTAGTEVVRSVSRQRFAAEAQRYLPALDPASLVRARAGIRAQAVSRDGTLVDDFVVDRDGPIAWVRNAPSPAATSSMAIAEELLLRLEAWAATPRPQAAGEGDHRTGPPRLARGSAHRRSARGIMDGVAPGGHPIRPKEPSAPMSAPTATPAAALDPAERQLRERILKAIVVVSVIDLFLFLPLIYGLAVGNEDLSPIFGPLHGTGFIIEVGLVAWGSVQKWWGWWYLAITLITTGPPGALLGHGKAKREALG